MNDLLRACKENDTEAAAALLADGAFAQRLSRLQLTLRDACRKNHVEIAAVLIEAGVNPGGGKKRNRPLFAACEAGAAEIVRMLLDAGANPDPGSGCLRPLFVACSENHVEICRMLLAAGAYSARRKDERSCITAAAGKGHWEIVSLFLGTDVDEPVFWERGGRSRWDMFAGFQLYVILSYVFTAKKENVATMLVERLITMNHRDVFGDALRTVCSYGRVADAQTFIAAGALEFWRPDNKFVDTLCREGRAAVLDLLHRNGTELGASALSAACFAGKVQVVERLIALGVAETFPPSDATMSRLYESQHAGVVDLLHSSGVPIRDNAFMRALDGPCLEMFRVLIAKGALRRGPPSTFVMESLCFRGAVDIVDLLLQNGVELPGEAMERACEGGHAPMVRYLVAAGLDPASGSDIAFRTPTQRHPVMEVLLLANVPSPYTPGEHDPPGVTWTTRTHHLFHPTTRVPILIAQMAWRRLREEESEEATLGWLPLELVDHICAWVATPSSGR